MNRRVIVILIAGVVMVGGMWTLLTLTRSTVEPSDTTRETRGRRCGSGSSAGASGHAGATRHRDLWCGWSAEPRRRPAAPAPAAAPTTAAGGVPNPDLVTLRVDSDVPGAQVFVDRNFLGQTPFVTTAIKPGAHRLNVSAPGYEGVAQSLELTPGSREVVVKLREVRLDATLAVVHKHRMGSCSGRLVATPQGIRYETTDKDDAFRSGLLDLEMFDVDYLEKNLRLKLEAGKAVRLHRSRGQRRSAVRVPPRRRQGARAVEEGRSASQSVMANSDCRFQISDWHFRTSDFVLPLRRAASARSR